MKLKVVFDASAKTTNNKCLKDILWIGPSVHFKNGQMAVCSFGGH